MELPSPERIASRARGGVYEAVRARLLGSISGVIDVEAAPESPAWEFIADVIITGLILE